MFGVVRLETICNWYRAGDLCRLIPVQMKRMNRCQQMRLLLKQQLLSISQWSPGDEVSQAKHDTVKNTFQTEVSIGGGPF